MPEHTAEKLLTGIPELDVVLRGGLSKGRVHLIEGDPGTGKTTIATQFLLEGVKRKGSRGLYVTMSESAEELRSSATSHGWDLDEIDLFELVPLEAQINEQQTVLYPAEMELTETIRLITDKITEGEAEPTKYWLSTLPEDTSLAALVDTAKLRWRIERDYEDLKSELGLGHYEGRGWRGFHHHATLCIAAYGFLVCERTAIPPSASWPRTVFGLPGRPQSRASADPARATRRKLDRDAPKTVHRRSRQNPREMPVLPGHLAQSVFPDALVTQ